MKAHLFKIPSTLENEVVIIDNYYANEDIRVVTATIGICKPEDSESAKEKIRAKITQEYQERLSAIHYQYDFRHRTTIGAKKWYIEQEFMVYENTERTDSNCAVTTKNATGYEKMYCLLGEIART